MMSKRLPQLCKMGVSQSFAPLPAWYFQARSGPTIWIVGSAAFIAATNAVAVVQTSAGV